MASSTIDTLQVKISANANDASKALNALAESLKKVKTALSGVGKDGLRVSEHIAQSLNEMSVALSQITTGSVKKLQKLAGALNEYGAACQTVKQAGDISKQIKAVQKSLETGNTRTSSTALVKYAESSAELATIMQPLVKYQGAGGLAETLQSSTALVALGGKSGGMDMSDALDTMERVTDEGMAAKVRMSLGLWIKLKYELRQFGKKASEALGNVSERLKDFNKNIRLSTGVFNRFLHSIGRIMLYRMIRSALKAIGKAFSEGLENAYMYSQQSDNFKELADAMDHLKSVASQMINQLGAFYGEFIQFIKPALEWMIEKVRQLAEFITELFAGLNGKNEYQFALLEDLKWKEATDSLKAYKHQLLGLDELNNLTKNQSSKKEEEDYLSKYELRPVRESFREIGQGWQSIKETIQTAYEEIEGLAYLPVGMVALGTLLLFTGHPLLGLGLILKGVQWTVEELKMQNEDLKKKIEGFFEEYKDLFNTIGNAAVAVGTLLLFVPGHRALGLGLILSGVMLKNLVNDKVKFSWGGMLETIKKKFQGYEGLFHKAGVASIAVGTMLLFVPGFRGLGLGLIMAGISLDALSESIPNFSWGGLLNTILKRFDDYKAAFVVGSSAVFALGAILLFVPGMRGLGLKLMKLGMPGMFVGAMTIDWGSLLADVKKAFTDVMDWIDEHVILPLKDKWYQLEKLVHRDLNDDGEIGWPTAKEAVSVGTKQLDNINDYFGGSGGTKENPFDTATAKLKAGDANLTAEEKKALAEWQQNLDPNKMALGLYKDLGESVKDNWLYNLLQFLPTSLLPTNLFSLFKAKGGIVSSGSLFVAGEAGPELVGSMGSSSAVANTSQMTDAIYKAAYMGMSRALAENGGNGLAGFVPATTDDLFIAMRKKASNYNKVTGNSAFA